MIFVMESLLGIVFIFGEFVFPITLGDGHSHVLEIPHIFNRPIGNNFFSLFF